MFNNGFDLALFCSGGTSCLILGSCKHNWLHPQVGRWRRSGWWHLVFRKVAHACQQLSPGKKQGWIHWSRKNGGKKMQKNKRKDTLNSKQELIEQLLWDAITPQYFPLSFQSFSLSSKCSAEKIWSLLWWLHTESPLWPLNEHLCGNS